MAAMGAEQTSARPAPAMALDPKQRRSTASVGTVRHAPCGSPVSVRPNSSMIASQSSASWHAAFMPPRYGPLDPQTMDRIGHPVAPRRTHPRLALPGNARMRGHGPRLW